MLVKWYAPAYKVLLLEKKGQYCQVFDLHVHVQQKHRRIGSQIMIMYSFP